MPTAVLHLQHSMHMLICACEGLNETEEGSENVTKSVNRCHASTVQKMYLLIFVITGVITKKTNVFFIRKLNVRGL